MRAKWAVCIFCLGAYISPLRAQESERLGSPPLLWAVPHLQLYTDADDKRALFQGLDISLALPLSPRSHLLASWLWDIADKDVATVNLNYDFPFSPNAILRGYVGVVRDEFAYGILAHRFRQKTGLGIFGQFVDGNFEGGVLLTHKFPWGVKLGRLSSLRRNESTRWPSGEGAHIGDIGACAALVFRAGEADRELFTTSLFIPSYRQSWPREGQSAQAVSAVGAPFAPPLKPVWKYHTEGAVRAGMAIVDGVAYVGSHDGWLYALQLSSGRRLWRFPAAAPITGSIAYASGRIYFGTEAGEIFCVAAPGKNDPPAGKLVWKFSASGSVKAAPLLTETGLLIVGACDGYIYSLRQADGRLVWKIATEGPVLASAVKLSLPVPGDISSGGTPMKHARAIVVGSSDGRLYSIDEVRGQIIWTFRTDGPITATAPCLHNRIFVVNHTGSIYALEGVAGQLVWHSKLSGSLPFAPALNEKRLFVSSLEGELYALEAQTGQILWQIALPAAPAASPTLVEENWLFVPTGDGQIWTLNSDTGQIISVQRESEALMTYAAIAEGHLLLGGETGTIYAYVSGKGKQPLLPADTAQLPQPAASAPATLKSPQPAGEKQSEALNEPSAAQSMASSPPPSASTIQGAAGAHETASLKEPKEFPAPTIMAPTSGSMAVPLIGQPANPPVLPPSAGAHALAGPEACAKPCSLCAPSASSSALSSASSGETTTQRPSENISLPTKLPDAPLLTLLLAPAGEQMPLVLTNQNYLFVGGKIAPDSGIVAVRVNGQEVPIKDGAYQTQISFPGPGEYILSVEAIDSAGQITAQRRLIRIQSDPQKPTGDILQLRRQDNKLGVTIVPGLRAPQAEQYRKIVEIRNARGQLVQDWAAEGNAALEISWKGVNANGSPLPAGEYEILYIVSGPQGPVAMLRQRLQLLP